MPGPLAGTLNALNAPQLPPEQAGLVIPTAPPSGPRQPPQREMGLGEILSKLGGMVGQMPDIAQRTAWNLGPALVGRSLQGPQTGADALERLGLNYDSPWQRALGHGGGKALDILAHPANLIGMGVARPGAVAEAGNLTRQLEQYAVPGVQDMSRTARAATGSRITPFPQPPPLGTLPTGLPTDIEALRRMGVTAPGPASAPSSFAATKPTGLLQQPRQVPYNPVTSFAESPSSPSFLQQPAPPRGFPDFPTQLESSRFMPGAQQAAPAADVSAILARRLEQFTPPSSPRPFPNGPVDY